MDLQEIWLYLQVTADHLVETGYVKRTWLIAIAAYYIWSTTVSVICAVIVGYTLLSTRGETKKSSTLITPDEVSPLLGKEGEEKKTNSIDTGGLNTREAFELLVGTCFAPWRLSVLLFVFIPGWIVTRICSIVAYPSEEMVIQQMSTDGALPVSNSFVRRTRAIKRRLWRSVTILLGCQLNEDVRGGRARGKFDIFKNDVEAVEWSEGVEVSTNSERLKLFNKLGIILLLDRRGDLFERLVFNILPANTDVIKQTKNSDASCGGHLGTFVNVSRMAKKELRVRADLDALFWTENHPRPIRPLVLRQEYLQEMQNHWTISDNNQLISRFRHVTYLKLRYCHWGNKMSIRATGNLTQFILMLCSMRPMKCSMSWSFLELDRSVSLQ